MIVNFHLGFFFCLLLFVRELIKRIWFEFKTKFHLTIGKHFLNILFHLVEFTVLRSPDGVQCAE